MNEDWTDEDFFKMMESIASDDVKGLEKAQQSYGDSWKKRGGVGAFMMMARKWDRLELQAMKELYDVFKAIGNDPRSESIIDDIRDLRRYLFLIETLMAMRGVIQIGNHRDSDVEELNDIKDKEIHLEKVKQDVPVKVMMLTDEHKEMVKNGYLCVPLDPQPPEWARHAARRTGFYNGFSLVNYQDGKAEKIWPSLVDDPLYPPYDIGTVLIVDEYEFEVRSFFLRKNAETNFLWCWTTEFRDVIRAKSTKELEEELSSKLNDIKDKDAVLEKAKALIP